MAQNTAMLDRSQIRPVHWQMKTAPTGAVIGEIVTDIDDLEQSIRQCILTPKRSVPLNPEKGCDLDQYRDRPLNIRHLFVVAEVREALARDVPRITVRDLSVNTDFGSIAIKVTWAPAELVLDDFITTEVAYVF